MDDDLIKKPGDSWDSPLFFRCGVVMAVVGLLFVNLGIWESFHKGPKVDIPTYFGAAVGLGQLGIAAMVHWYLNQYRGFQKVLAALRCVLPLLITTLATVIILRAGGAPLDSQPFIVIAMSGTLLVVTRMGCTAIAIILIAQAAAEAVTRRRQL